MTSRLNVENIIDRIEREYGLGSFLDLMVTEILSGDTIAMMANRLPFKISEQKMKLVMEFFFPEIKDDRKNRIRHAMAPHSSELFKLKSEGWFYTQQFKPNHSLFKYFTTEWYKKFIDQRSMARRRKVTFEFDFSEWIMWWIASGKIEERGIGNNYQMCRYNDKGPYSWDNCYCARGHINREHARELRRQVRVL
jgi:hypothetical protein